MAIRNDKSGSKPAMSLARKRRMAEAVSTMGLILLAAGLVAPFTNFENDTLVCVFKWIFAVGALTYTCARAVNVNAPSDSARLRRLRRMELWAGIAFCVAAGFWFYNSSRFEGMPFSLAIMNDTIVFTLAGAIIQIVASWLISAQARKEANGKS